VITVVIPISPIKSHPGIEILSQTVESVRHWLPDAEIILTFDGVRREQEGRRAAYEAHIFRVLELADWTWGGCLPLIFDDHQHQTGMMRAALEKIRTPLLLYVEQDTPLVTDEPIDWDAIRWFVESGQSNVVRLYHEGVTPAEHHHLMHGHNGVFIRTSQWSQRPHVASTAYYRRIMASHFTAGARSFIEDQMHGVLDEAYHRDGIAGWNQHRVHIYDPGNGNMKRSYHTDGRAGAEKFDDSQIF